MNAAHLITVGLAGLALMLLACAWAFLLRGGPAAARQRIWRLGFVALLAMSGLSFVPWLPRLPGLREPTRAALPVVMTTTAVADSNTSPALVPAVRSSASAHSEAPAERPVGGKLAWANLLVAAWLTGLALLLTRWLVGLVRVARWASRAVTIDRETDPLGQRLGQEVPGSVEVRLHPECLLPVTVGLFRPAVLLPPEARDWDPGRLRIVLLHELAHVKGRDPLHRAIAELGTMLHWPNPMTWLAKGRLRLEQEHAADDAVLTSGVRPASYASELIALAETVSLQLSGAVPMAEKAGLTNRIEHIIAAGKVRSESPRAALAATLFFCLAAAGLASLPFRPADAVPRNSSPPPRSEHPRLQVVSCDALGSVKPPSSDQEMAVHWWNDSQAPISIASVDADGRLQTKDAPVVAPGSGHTVWRKVGQLGVAVGPSGNCLAAVAYQLGQNDILLREGGRISGREASDRIAALVAAQDQYTERAACADLGTLKSPGGGLWRAVRFWNDTGLPIAIDSIDESGKREFVMSLASGAVKDWGTQDWHLFVASTSDGLCLGVAAGPKDGQDVVFTASGALHGSEREARIDALAVAKAAASEAQLAACRAAVSAGSADQVKLNDCRRVLRGLAGAYDPKLPPEGTALAADFTDDFQRAEIGPNYFASSARWRILDGELTASDGKNQPLWLRAALPADVRIEFDARSDSPEGDIKCELFGDGYSHASGYILILAGWENSLTTLARLSEHAPAVTSFAEGPAPSGQMRVERRDLRVEPGRVYHWLIQRRGGTILWQVDGETVFEETDPQPLVGPGHDRFGFSGWETSVHFDNLKVAQLR